MPIYEYQCESCGHALEKLQRINDDHLKDCPDCGEMELRRLVSAAAFRLKGAGWYETDFKKGDKKNLHDAGSSKSSASDSSDSKSAAAQTDSNKTSTSKTGTSETSKPAAVKKTESKPKSTHSGAT